MKLSTMGKEYIKDKVKERYPLRVCEDKLENEIITELNERIKSETKDIAEKIAKEFNDRLVVKTYRDGKWIYDDFEITLTGKYNGGLYSRETVEILQYNEEIKAKREKVYREIVVSMELGGTKAELEEMLKNLPD